MTFQFSTYLIYTLILPAVVLVVTTPVVFKAANFLFTVIRDRDFSGNGKPMLLGALVLVFCIAPQALYLANGSYHLVTERAADAVVISGTVDGITAPSQRFPGLRADDYQGADLIIDGEEYFVLSAQDLEPGDTVTVEVMPKSRMILTWSSETE